MRILYEQFTAYSRAYVSRLPKYTEQDDHFVRVSISLAATVNAICDSIAFGAAGARAPLVPSATAPPNLVRDSNPAGPDVFLSVPSPTCTEWLSATKRFTDDTAAWRTVDPNIPASELSIEQRMLNNAAAPIMEAFATEELLIGRKSDNAVWADIAILSAQYRRAYVSALPTYAPADNDLQVAAGSAAGSISEACRAVGA